MQQKILYEPQHFFANGSFLGTGLGPSVLFADGEAIRLLSYAYFCATCGEIWGRRVIPGRSWGITHHGCRKCGYAPNPFLAGSFLDPPDRINGFIDPPDCIARWEFDSATLTLERMENG